jgi:hypothetical protein
MTTDLKQWAEELNKTLVTLTSESERNRNAINGVQRRLDDVASSVATRENYARNSIHNMLNTIDALAARVAALEAHPFASALVTGDTLVIPAEAARACRPEEVSGTAPGRPAASPAPLVERMMKAFQSAEGSRGTEWMRAALAVAAEELLADITSKEWNTAMDGRDYMEPGEIADAVLRRRRERAR